MSSNNDVVFKEVQRFRQPLLWLVILAIMIIFTYGMFRQIILGEPWGNKPLPDAMLIAIFTFIMCLTLLFFFVKLIVEVRSDGIYIRFFPFHISYRKIPLENLKKCEACIYSPLEYGGWGIRYGFKGKAYTISGNRGVILELKDGKKLLIGSQKPKELVKAIDTVLKKRKQSLIS